MTPIDPTPRGSGGNRTLIPLLVVLLGVALGVGGVLLLRPFTGTSSGSSVAGRPQTAFPAAPSVTRTAAGRAASRLSAHGVYARVAPSVLDVTSSLRYDNETASGTGFVFDARRGLVLTNNHVIRDATAVRVTVPATGRSYRAMVVGTDMPADVAVLQLAGAPRLPAVRFADSARLRPGTPVLAIGNQAGAGGSPAIASGEVSGTGRTILADDGSTGFTETLHGMLQVTAQIQPGDSGGPLADTAGRVVGVNTAAGTGTTATGYAIPIDVALRSARRIADGQRGRGVALGTGGFLGVVLPASAATSPRQQASEERSLRRHAGEDRPAGACLRTEEGARVPTRIAAAQTGALVDGVLCGTAAAAAGIAPGDVIIRANGRRVSSPDELTALVGACRPGSLLSVTWIAVAGGTRTAVIRLNAAPAA